MSLYFANCDLFLSDIKSKVEARNEECLEKEATEMEWLVLDASSFNFVDHSGVAALFSLLLFCSKRDIRLLMVLSDQSIVNKLEREQFTYELGKHNLYPSLNDAVNFVKNQLSDEESPLVDNGSHVIDILTDLSAVNGYGSVSSLSAKQPLISQ